MAKDPAFLFYSSDFLTGTALFTSAETGDYIKLLCYIHQHGPLMMEDMKIICPNLTKKVAAKFKERDGKFFNERLENEIEKRKKHLVHQSENGKKGGRPKKPIPNPNETQTQSQTKPNRKPLENANENRTDNEIISLRGTGDFSFDLKTEIPKTAIEAAELNQFDLTKNKNSQFVKNQWKIFLSERMNDPPAKAKRYDSISELTSYFLNWIRTKTPQKNGSHSKTSTTGIKKSAGAERLVGLLGEEIANDTGGAAND